MITTDQLERLTPLKAPQTLAEAGLSVDLVSQIALKLLHFAGELTGLQLADRLGLNFTVIEPAIESLKSQQLCSIVGGTSLGAPSYIYRVTSLGREHAGLFLERNMYAGVAPVPIAQYRKYMKEFSEATARPATQQEVREAFSHLVLSDRVVDQLGPAVNAGHSLFVYGPPGNGKTVISMAIRNLLKEDFWIPHAIEVDGSLIQLFDRANHEPLPMGEPGPGLDVTNAYDRRWIRCRRPAIVVGGELTLDHFELTYSANAGFYRPPVQLLANGGVLVIDDFGRQAVPPGALLNRWITPLESRVDFLRLESGQQVEVPFMVLPVFATNIKPKELVDEAFLRRIHFKVFAESPTATEFVQIFDRACQDRKVEFDYTLPVYLLNDALPKRGIVPRGCHPRDLIDHALARAEYLDLPRRVTKELLEEACASYFVDEREGGSSF